MRRYIDADRFKDTLEGASKKMYLICGIKGVDIDAVIKAVDMFPTADVVEVVRCKDCKNLTEQMVGDDLEYICKCFDGMINPAPNLYCSYGERSENEKS